MNKLFRTIYVSIFLAATVIFPAGSALSQVNPAGALANPPSALPISTVSRTSVTASWGANGNPSGIEYLCENTTAMTNSSWITGVSWKSSGLTPGTSYTYTVKARNNDGIETASVNLGTKTTISYMYLNGVTVRAWDTIFDIPKVEFKINHSVPLTLASCGVLIDGTLYGYDSAVEDTGSTTFTYTVKSPLSTGQHEIGVRAIDSDTTEYFDSVKNLIVRDSSSPAVISKPFCYPNPYDAALGKAAISYVLSTDSDITVYIFDDTGMVVVKKEYAAGSSGGRSGYNEIEWDGNNEAGSSIKNGAYVAAVVCGGKMLGKAKIMLLRSR